VAKVLWGNGVLSHYIVGALLGTTITVLGFRLSNDRTDSFRLSTGSTPYLLKPQAPIEGLCRYHAMLNVNELLWQDFAQGGTTIGLVESPGSYVRISFGRNEGLAPVVAQTFDVSGHSATLTKGGDFRILKWSTGPFEVAMYAHKVTESELLRVARSLRFTFDDSGPRLVSINDRGFQPNGEVLFGGSAFGGLTLDDCQRGAGASRRKVMVLTSRVLSGVETKFAFPWGPDASQRSSDVVSLQRRTNTVRAQRTRARIEGEDVQVLTWVENNAQVSVRSNGFSMETVDAFIRTLTLATVSDYRVMQKG
jgi:hypothetical protein